MEELIHIEAESILAIHDAVLRSSGGRAGERQDLSINAVLGRIHNRILYSPFNNLLEVGAFYAESIAKGHVFIDGNKRTGLITMMIFFEVNGAEVDVDDHSVGVQMEKIAKSEISYVQLAIWLQQNNRVHNDFSLSGK